MSVSECMIKLNKSKCIGISSIYSYLVRSEKSQRTKSGKISLCGGKIPLEVQVDVSQCGFLRTG